MTDLSFESLPKAVATLYQELQEIKGLLLRQSDSKPKVDLWFNLDELRNYLPDKPARQTVYGWVHQRLIPYHKGKKRLRFLKSEVDQWLLSEKRRTLFEVQDSIKVPKKKGRASHQKPAR